MDLTLTQTVRCIAQRRSMGRPRPAVLGHTFPAFQPMNLHEIPVAQRKPVRITSTVPAVVVAWLIDQSNFQGRSLSNFVSHVLEMAMHRATSASLNSTAGKTKQSALGREVA